jgi:hypothetical protein
VRASGLAIEEEHEERVSASRAMRPRSISRRRSVEAVAEIGAVRRTTAAAVPGIRTAADDGEPAVAFLLVQRL